MQELFLEPAGSLIKTTLVDFPGRVAATVFLEGCNLRCPYCYNGSLVLGKNSPDCINGSRNYPCSTLQEVIDHIEKRKGLLTGLVISGGEPLLNPRTEILIRKAKSAGYKIKLDTNGTLPDLLQKFCEDEELKPDYIAMDIKTDPEHYSAMLENISDEKNRITADEKLYDSLKRSCRIISSVFSPQQREWRTVLVPSLTDEEQIKKMAAILPSDARWFFSQFRNENCLNPSYNNISPYLDADIARLIQTAKEIIPGAELR